MCLRDETARGAVGAHTNVRGAALRPPPPPPRARAPAPPPPPPGGAAREANTREARPTAHTGLHALRLALGWATRLAIMCVPLAVPALRPLRARPRVAPL